MVRSLFDRVSDDNAFSTPLQLVALAPTQPARLSDGSANPSTIYFNGLIQDDNSNRNTEIYRTLGNVYGAYEFFPGFSFRTEFGLDILDQQEDNFLGRETLDGAPSGLAESRSLRVINYSSNSFFSYDKALNEDNALQLVLGLSYQQSDTKITSIQATGFPNDDFTTIASAAEPTFTSSSATAFSFLSYFARANYKFKDRYLLAVSGRIDGSSKFGEDNRYGFFPAVSAGWILSNEPFLINSNTFSFVKLRASFGDYR